VNVNGSFLLAQQFIKALPSPSTPSTILNLITSGSWDVHPTMSGYCISKTAKLQLTTYIATSYPNITAVAIHPGMLDTDMMLDAFRPFDFNTPELIGGLSVWLSGERAKFLSGRAIAANWDVDDLVGRKEEIEAGNLLRLQLAGKFGKEQFV
jgi:NAD(P)-dependent dehydrogenase (short-subunit alcohol dehydrogenase family)